METFKPNFPNRGHAALLAAACLIFPLHTGKSKESSRMAEGEVSRRMVALEEAQKLLRKGDESYTAGRYADAVEAYAGARDLIPDAPVSAELRAAATERYAQAAVENARLLVRTGDLAGAKASVEKVLADAVAPDHPGALAMRGQLDDPIRTNPALTAEYGKNVDAVRRLLYTAEGALNLGNYDQAKSTFQDVLRIDPTNSAARRGMEQVATAKSDYANSARDHTRAKMLGQIDREWELQVPALDLEASLTNPGYGDVNADPVSVKNKLARIIIPKIALEQASLDEALDFLRLRARENDTVESDPDRKGVNFTVNLGAPDSPAAIKARSTRFDLRLNNVPLAQVLEYITANTSTSFTTDDFSVIIAPSGTGSGALSARTYRVPPDFINSMSSGATATATDDPFAEAPASTGLLAKRVGALEALTGQGVDFPEGATANYSAATNTLRIVNTDNNLDYIGRLIDAVTKTDPVMVSITVTMIKVEETHLQELSFDWLLDNFGFDGPSAVPGSNRLNLSGGTVGNGDNLDDIALAPGGTARNPITSGNRSGDSAIAGNSIDALINDNGGRQASNRAPGIFGVRGGIDQGTVQTLMRGLDQKKSTDVMAKPSTVTRSGQSSSVKIIREFIYPTEYEPPQLPNDTGGTDGFSGGGQTPVTPATPTAFTKRDVGITLEVLPVADADKQFVNVTLNPSFVDFDGFVNYGSPINSTQSGPLGPETVTLTPNEILMPIFSNKTFSTNVDVADGATVVVGGLMQESVQNVEDQTPILGSIPIIGRLFQSKANKPISTALLFLVNVELMDPTGHRYRDR